MINRINSLVLFAVLSTSVVALATPQQSQTQTDLKPPSIAKRLALTHDQQVQFKAIHKDQKAQLDAVTADTTLSPRARKQKVKEIHLAADAKIRAILNQNQLEEYEQIKRERQEAAKMKREGVAPMPPAPPPSAPPQ
jgi:hypothetical protein